MQTAPGGLLIHYLVVDHDGEVRMDPQSVQPEVDLAKFRFRIHITELSRRVMTVGSHSLHLLFHKLVSGWNRTAGDRR